MADIHRAQKVTMAAFHDGHESFHSELHIKGDLICEMQFRSDRVLRFVLICLPLKCMHINFTNYILYIPMKMYF